MLTSTKGHTFVFPTKSVPPHLCTGFNLYCRTFISVLFFFPLWKKKVKKRRNKKTEAQSTQELKELLKECLFYFLRSANKDLDAVGFYQPFDRRFSFLKLHFLFSLFHGTRSKRMHMFFFQKCPPVA